MTQPLKEDVEAEVVSLALAAVRSRKRLGRRLEIEACVVAAERAVGSTLSREAYRTAVDWIERIV